MVDYELWAETKWALVIGTHSSVPVHPRTGAGLLS